MTHMLRATHSNVTKTRKVRRETCIQRRFGLSLENGLAMLCLREKEDVEPPSNFAVSRHAQQERATGKRAGPCGSELPLARLTFNQPCRDGLRPAPVTFALWL